jgi:glycosyltransferase involved in cell wall biosynthesis
MGDQPLVTVVIPNHNYGHFVHEAVRSVWAQTHPNVELVVVDDGSTDDSMDVLRALEAEGPMRLLPDPWRGAARTKHRGVLAARGEFVCVLDADDRLAPEYLRKTLQVLQSDPAAGYCYTAIHFFGAEDRLWSPGPFDPKRLYLGDSYIHTGALMRRSAYARTPGFRIRRSAEDFDLWLSMLAKGLHGCYLDEPLYEYRRHGHARHRDANTWLMRSIKLRHPRLLLRYAAPQLTRTTANLVTLRPVRVALQNRRSRQAVGSVPRPNADAEGPERYRSR